MKAIITGSSRGFGLVLAEKFAELGYDLWINGRDAAALDSVKQKLEDDCMIHVTAMCMDIRNSDAIKSILYQIQLHKIDVVINNAGIMYGTPNEIIETNMIAPAKIIHGCIGQDLTIININSVAGLKGNANEDFYCASKFGLRGYSESVKWAASKVGTNIIDVYLGAMNIGMAANRDDNEKLMNPEEVADRIIDLLQCNTCIPELRLYRN